VFATYARVALSGCGEWLEAFLYQLIRFLLASSDIMSGMTSVVWRNCAVY
jgi:hypothetical protein